MADLLVTGRRETKDLVHIHPEYYVNFQKHHRVVGSSTEMRRRSLEIWI